MTVTLNTNYIPTIAAGSLFERLTQDLSLNVRWVTPVDPVAFFTYNRPMADITVRQLAIAKAVDSIGVSLSHLTLFPFIVQPQVGNGSTIVELPHAWLWDMHVSLPSTWENVRLAKIQRISGLNQETTDGLIYTGKVRLIFSANKRGSTTEQSVFYAEYNIESQLTYQLVRVELVTSEIDEDAVTSADTESSTISGFINFRTLDLSVAATQQLLDALAPPDPATDADSDGSYDSPAVYEIIDSEVGGPTVADDFALSAVSHGTGLLTYGSWNSIPAAYNNIQSWVESVNYPFDDTANRLSTTSVRIPNGLFREFNIVAPAGDQYTGDTTGLTFPVYVSRVEALGTTEDSLRLYFATFGVSDEAPTTQPIEFAFLDLTRTMLAGEVVSITPLTDLFGQDDELYTQHFGRGHVVLSDKWTDNISEIIDFFDYFSVLVASPRDISFSQSSTRISSFGVSRVPKYVPTMGQSQALVGTTASRVTPISPSSTNRFVTEQDQGLGDQVDLEALPGITPVTTIQRYGYSGSLCHRVVRLDVAGSETSTGDFYEDQVLPRLTALYGRAPQFGDVWYNGVRFVTFNGDTWQTS